MKVKLSHISGKDIYIYHFRPTWCFRQAVASSLSYAFCSLCTKSEMTYSWPEHFTRPNSCTLLTELICKWSVLTLSTAAVLSRQNPPTKILCPTTTNQKLPSSQSSLNTYSIYVSYVLALQWGKPFDLPKYAQRKCAREYPNCLFFS